MEGAAATSSACCMSRPPPFFPPSFHYKPSLFLTEHFHSQLLKSSSASDGNRKNRLNKTNYAMDERSSQEDERRMPRGSSSGRWSNQKRLLALFKQIETSISLEKARSTDQSDAKSSSEDDNASLDSVLEALQQSGRSGKGPTPSKELNLPGPQPSAYMSTRPPSSFTKKSPIPSPSTPTIRGIEQNAVAESHDRGAVEEEEEEPSGLEKLKLTELKEVAKSRGIKGYSKMKKSVLVGLLSTEAES